MSDKKITNEIIKEMYELIVSLKSVEDCRDLFGDMCTNKEIEQMAQRIKAARLLLDGKTYNQVIEETDISSATLSRVSRCVQYGNGYSKLLKGSKGDR
ncbi:MAG: YerC/YecD family TrpR-related protein [Acutalibacteraceae bacterium]